VANANNRLFHRHGVPSPRQAAKLVVRSTANGASPTAPATGTRRDDSATRGSQSPLLWLSTHPCRAQAAWNGLQSQNSLASVAATWVAVGQSETHHPVGAAARRAGARIGTQSAVGFRHDQYPSVGWSKGPLRSHDRLCGPHGVGLAIRPTHYGHQSHRDASGSALATVWRRTDPRTRNRVAQRQWTGIHLQQVPHSALAMQSPAEYHAKWLVTTKNRPVQN
jgi:hypothetical protein